MNYEMTIEERWVALTTAEQEAVKAIHLLLREIKESPERYSDPVQAIEDFEFSLQAIWKFERDARFHTHKWEISGCTCPKLDNAERFGSPYKIINEGCRWHSVIK